MPATTTVATRSRARRGTPDATTVPLHSRLTCSSMARGALRSGQVACRIDERHVGEGLWEVADKTRCGGIVLLPEETHVVAQSGPSLQQQAGLPFAALQKRVGPMPKPAN